MQSTYNDPYPNIPEELKLLKQWVLWKTEIRSGKPTKIPYQINHAKAKSNDTSTWTDYQSVCRAFISQQKKWDGIGFVFSEAEPLCGIDLDVRGHVGEGTR